MGPAPSKTDPSLGKSASTFKHPPTATTSTALLGTVQSEPSRFKTRNRITFLHLSHPDLLVVGSQNGGVTFFQLDTMERVKEEKLHKQLISSIGSNSQYIIVGSHSSIFVVDKNHLSCVKHIEVEEEWVRSVALDDDILVTAADNKARRWNKDNVHSFFLCH